MENVYTYELPGSQGGIVDVYEDYVVVRWIDFTNPYSRDYTTTAKYMPIALYKLDVPAGTI